MGKVVIADADDWQGLYINGKLVKQDHRIEPKDILKALGVTFEDKDIDYDWFFDRAGGSFPEKLSDVKFHKVSMGKKPKGG